MMIFITTIQVMDNGTLTDNSGRIADFRHAIVIMTSNVGAHVFTTNTLGFVFKIKRLIAMLKLIESSAWFRNRLDAIAV